MLAWSLAAHPAFWTSAESDYLHYVFGRRQLRTAYQTAAGRADGGWLQANEVGYAEFARAMGLGVERLYESRSRGKRWVDATPGYTLMADDLHLMCPEARFLHILRDGRAVVSSMQRSGFGTDWSKDFGLACETWVRYASVAEQFVAANPARAMTVRHAEMIASPDQEFERIFSFLGETSDGRAAEMIRTQRINSSYGNAKLEDVRRAKRPEAAPSSPWSTWSNRERKIFEKTAGPTMEALGLSASGTPSAAAGP